MKPKNISDSPITDHYFHGQGQHDICSVCGKSASRHQYKSLAEMAAAYKEVPPGGMATHK